MSDKSLTKKRT